MTQSAIAVFNAADSFAVSFTDKKGVPHSRTLEGALWKGGAALKQLKDEAAQAAFSKAQAGRYKAAAEIIADTFGTVARKFSKECGTPWANAMMMSAFLTQVREYQPKEGKSLTKKQETVAQLVELLRTVPALAKDVKPQVVLSVVEEAQ